MGGHTALHGDAAPCRRRTAQIGGCGNAVGDHPVTHRMKRIHPVHDQRSGKVLPDSGAGSIQEADQIIDLRLLGRAPQNGASLCQHRRNEDILGRPHRRETEHNLSSVQPSHGDSAVQGAMVLPDHRTHALQRGQMQINGPGPQLTAAGEGYPGPSVPGQDRPEKNDGRTHLPHTAFGNFPALG